MEPIAGRLDGRSPWALDKAHWLKQTCSMFSAKDIKELMDAKPFRPFKVYLSDGSSYEVNNHDMAFVTKNNVEIGLHLDPDGIAERTVKCDILHISRIEELQPA